MKAIITGATKGIGRAIVNAFAAEGYDLAICARTEADVKVLKNELETQYPNGAFIAEAVDMSDKSAVKAFGKSIVDQEGRRFPMANVFNFTTSMEQARMRLGYREVVMDDVRLKGHKFHYSGFVEQQETPYEATVLNAKGIKVETGIFVKKKAMASYVHHYFGEKKLLLNLLNKLEAL